MWLFFIEAWVFFTSSSSLPLHSSWQPKSCPTTIHLCPLNLFLYPFTEERHSVALLLSLVFKHHPPSCHLLFSLHSFHEETECLFLSQNTKKVNRILMGRKSEFWDHCQNSLFLVWKNMETRGKIQRRWKRKSNHHHYCHLQFLLLTIFFLPYCNSKYSGRIHSHLLLGGYNR